MLIKLLQDDNGILKRNKCIDKLKFEYKNDDYIQDIKHTQSLSDEFLEYNNWMKELNLEKNIKLVSDSCLSIKGVYITSLNWSTTLEQISMHKVVEDFSSILFNRELFNRGYGVCDNATQVIEYYNKLLCDMIVRIDKKYVIMLTPIFKSDQPDGGDWRWHKWGQYIGIQNPKHEYLYDEDNIDLVYVFKIQEVIDK